MEKLNVDCLSLIFNELTDAKSLYFCLLVNKEWCNLAVPILWKKYSRRFSDYDNDNDIKLPSTIFLKAPLFNYISFCKFPDRLNRFIDEIVYMVFGSKFNLENPKEKLL